MSIGLGRDTINKGQQMRTPEYILQKIRQRNDVDIDDQSYDEEFNRISPLENLRSVSGWELGDPDWSDQFIELAKDCGFEIKESREIGGEM